MPIPLGILAAAGIQPSAAGAYELIETVTVGSGGAASVSFTGLSAYSSTYEHLQIRMVVRTTRTDPSDNIRLRFNGDSTLNNYRFHRLNGDGSTVGSGTGTNSFIETYRAAGSTATANAFGASVVDILDAYSTSKNKVIRNLAGLPTEPSVWLSSGLWLNTAAITQIDLTSLNSFAQYSRFSIYGLKAS